MSEVQVQSPVDSVMLQGRITRRSVYTGLPSTPFRADEVDSDSTSADAHSKEDRGNSPERSGYRGGHRAKGSGRRSRSRKSLDFLTRSRMRSRSPALEPTPPTIEPPAEEKPYSDFFPDLDISRHLDFLRLPVPRPLPSHPPHLTTSPSSPSATKPTISSETLVPHDPAHNESSTGHDESCVTPPPAERQLNSQDEAAKSISMANPVPPMVADVETFEELISRELVEIPSSKPPYDRASHESVLDKGADDLPAASSEPIEEVAKNKDITEDLPTEEGALQVLDDDPYAGVSDLLSLPPLPNAPQNLPKPSFRRLSELAESPIPAKKFRLGAAYIRHTEPSEDELAQRIEYDMDEQDLCWLNMINDERKKENLVQIDEDYFERVMDILEKEWFDLTKDIPSAREDEEDPVCAVCDDGECENANAIVFCDGCNIAVHQDCYGIPFIPEGQWLCRKCMLSPHKPVDCVLCPHKDGAFKQTSRQGWAHLLCAMWVPECSVGNYTLMEPVVDIEKIPRSRWKLQCYLCHTRGGAPIQCSNKNCYLPFHPTCARKAKLYMKMRAQYGSDQNALRAFCDRHTPPEYREQVDVEAAVAAFQREMLEQKLSLVNSRRSAAIEDSEDEYPPVGTDTESSSRKRKRKNLMRITDDEESDARLDHGSDDLSSSKRKKKQRRLESSTSADFGVGGWSDDDETVGSSRSHQFSAPVPVIPEYILNRVLDTLRTEFKEKKKKGDFDKKNKDFIIRLCKYWSLKRESRRGAPLLKRLHLEPWTASASALKEDEEARAKRNQTAIIIRKDLERVRLLTELVRKREKEKLKQYQAGISYAEFVLFPITRFIRPFFETIRSWDKDGIFAEPVTPELAPDYHLFITNPMDFSTMMQKLENHEYKDVGSFETDVELIWQNCMTYNKPETPYWKTAQRFQKRGRPLLEELKQKITGFPIDPDSGILSIAPAEFFHILWAYWWPEGKVRELFPKEEEPLPTVKTVEEVSSVEEVQESAAGDAGDAVHVDDDQPKRMTRSRLAALEQETVQKPTRKGKVKQGTETPFSPRRGRPPKKANKPTSEAIPTPQSKVETPKATTKSRRNQILAQNEPVAEISDTPLRMRSTRKAAQVASEAVAAIATPAVRKTATVAATAAANSKGAVPKKEKEDITAPEPAVNLRESRGRKRRRESEVLETAAAEPAGQASPAERASKRSKKVQASESKEAETPKPKDETPRRRGRPPTRRDVAKSEVSSAPEDAASSSDIPSTPTPSMVRRKSSIASSARRSSIGLSGEGADERRHSIRHAKAFGHPLPKIEEVDLDDNPAMVQFLAMNKSKSPNRWQRKQKPKDDSNPDDPEERKQEEADDAHEAGGDGKDGKLDNTRGRRSEKHTDDPSENFTDVDDAEVDDHKEAASPLKNRANEMEGSGQNEDVQNSDGKGRRRTRRSKSVDGKKKGLFGWLFPKST
ncbi:uncharacterized protein SPPG_01085 [Spizellomyces punctatus DAOM BR117]|uniref:Uncharacterized protein n=1 Tax=Spizellomyces punctatus (strain DAOM BR117) TaxID=645134 RepID=A0A0L0HRU5_SPIPD|nr:uncharacterized protein SPPG_01085 [Spizellomyces punctatus DAOM BR117]KND03610.1 hypothetical protein SPPG_01085 [Spizellomyces punctatus DAOM BR117]|eukprot:XP_016611649.1 hypothetical protein SPPG_01085 [Spizellomyces punctatus DAOM BR117]